MRLQKYLNEEYDCRIKFLGKSYEVFANPSHKELRELKSIYIKFIADSRDKTVYVWSIEGPLHEDAWEQINSADLESDIFRGHILPGYSTLQGGKLKMDDSDGNHIVKSFMNDMNSSQLKSYINKWKWADKYVNVTNYLMGLDEEYAGTVKPKYSALSAIVFKNPSSKEIREATIRNKSMRFIADSKDKSIWVWDSMGALHQEVWREFKELNKGRNFADSIDKLEVMEGVAIVSGGKAKVKHSNVIDGGYASYSKEDMIQLKSNMKWVNRTIDLDSYLNALINKGG
jgi:hypothetical protein